MNYSSKSEKHGINAIYISKYTFDIDKFVFFLNSRKTYATYISIYNIGFVFT